VGVGCCQKSSATTEIAPRFYNIQFPPDFGVYVAPNCVTHTLNRTVDPQFHRSHRKAERHGLSWLHMERPEIFPDHLLAVLHLHIDIPKQSRGKPWVTVSLFRTTMIVSCDGLVLPTV
jgi:hypothetical protein